MKVKQLLEVLSTIDPETCVFVSGYEGGYSLASTNGEVLEFCLDVNDEWYYGSHEICNNVQDIDRYQKVNGIIL